MDIAYTSRHQVLIPDNEIKEDNHTYIYVPLRGYCATMAAFDIDDKCIGWISCITLGYNSVNEWMTATRWVDQGY